MLEALRNFLGFKPRPGISVGEVKDLFNTKFQGAIRRGVYEPPKLRCSRWILVRGPALGSRHHRGTLLVEAKSIEDWAVGHAKGVWSTVQAEQSAREFLPAWIQGSDPNDESVSIPDHDMLEVLQPYDQDFIVKGRIRLWCPDCACLHESVNCDTHDNERKGKTSTWVSEWRCPEGHVVHLEDNEIRWIVR